MKQVEKEDKDDEEYAITRTLWPSAGQDQVTHLGRIQQALRISQKVRQPGKRPQHYLEKKKGETPNDVAVAVVDSQP